MRAQNEPLYQLKALFLNESLSDEQWNQVKRAIQFLTAAIKEPERYSVLFSQLSSIFHDGTAKPKTLTKPFNNRSIFIDLHRVHFYLIHYFPEHIQRQTRSFRNVLEDGILAVDGMLTHEEWNQIFVQAKQEGLSIPSNIALQQNKLYKNQKTPYPELTKLLKNSSLEQISLVNLHTELNDIQNKLHQPDLVRTLLLTLQYLAKQLPSEIHKNQQSIPRAIINKLALLHFHMTHSGTSHDKNLSAPFRQAIEHLFEAAGVQLMVTDWEQMIQNYTQQTKTTFSPKKLTGNELFHKLNPSSKKEVYFFLKWHQRQTLSPWEMSQLIQQMNQADYDQSKTWQKRCYPEIEKLQRLVSSKKNLTELDPSKMDWPKWEVDYFAYLVHHLQPHQTLSEVQRKDLLAILYKWSKELMHIAGIKQEKLMITETLRFLRPFRQRLDADETFELTLTDQQQELLSAFQVFLNQLDETWKKVANFNSHKLKSSYYALSFYKLQQSFRIDSSLLPAPIIGQRVHKKQVQTFLDDCRLLTANDTDPSTIQRLQKNLYTFQQHLDELLQEDSETLKKKTYSFIEPFQIGLHQKPWHGITVSHANLFLSFSTFSEKLAQLSDRLKKIKQTPKKDSKTRDILSKKVEALAKQFDPQIVPNQSPFAQYTALAKTCNRLLQIDNYVVFKERLLTLLSFMKKQDWRAVQGPKNSHAGHFRTLLLLYAVQAKAEQLGLVENDPLQIKVTNAIRSFPWEEEWLNPEEKKALAADLLQDGRTVPSFIKESWAPQSIQVPSRTAFSSQKLNQMLDAIMFQQTHDHKRLQTIWKTTDLPPVQEMTALEQQQLLSSYIRLALILQKDKEKSLPTEWVSTLQSIQQKLQSHFNPLLLSKPEIGQVFQHLKTKGYVYSLATVVHFQIVERISQGFRFLSDQQAGRYQMTHQETANLKETVNLLNQQFDHLRRQGRQGRQFMQFVIKHLQQQIEMRRNTPLPPSRVEEKKPSLLLRSQLNQALSGLHARLSILTLEGILSSATILMLAIQPYMQNMNPTQRNQLQTQLESAGYPDHAIKRVFNKPTYASFAVEKLQREERVPPSDLLIHNPKDQYIANKKPTSYHEK